VVELLSKGKRSFVRGGYVFGMMHFESSEADVGFGAPEALSNCQPQMRAMLLGGETSGGAD
jgi:hypothetical protein